MKLFVSGVAELWPVHQIGSAACFCKAWKLRMVFTLFHGWKQNQNKNDILWHVKIIEIKISVALSKAQLGHDHAYSFTYHLWLLSHQQNWIVVTETIWPANQKHLLWSFTEKVCQPLVYSNRRKELTTIYNIMYSERSQNKRIHCDSCLEGPEQAELIYDQDRGIVPWKSVEGQKEGQGRLLGW